MPKKTKKSAEVTPALQYFFAVLEKNDLRQQALLAQSNQTLEVPIEQIEVFVRALKTQNIFIRTVGISGKQESTILSKAIFSLNKIVKIYYSTSFDERDSGFIRIRGDDDIQKIIVERVHGYRAVPEKLYSSRSQCHVVRYITQWIMKRIDWDKTKISTLEIYDLFVKQRLEEREEDMFEEEHWMEASATH